MRYLLALGLILEMTLHSFSQSSHPVLFRNKALDENPSLTIPGTKVTITPPKDFRLSKVLTGLQNGSSNIEVYDLPGGSFRVMVEDFTLEKFQQQGVKVIRIDETEVDGYPARIISLQNNEEQYGLTMVFGDDTFSVILVANYPSDDSALESSIREAFQNIRYDRNRVGDALASAAFRLNTGRCAFRFERKSASTYYYSLKNQRKENSYMTVTELAWDYETSPSDIGALMLTEMKKHGLEKPEMRKWSGRKINGYQAFESQVHATRKGENCFLYQVVLVHQDRVLIIHGLGKEDFRKNRDAFRKLAHSIHFR